MNNKGQTLVLFVALLPLIFGLFAFVFDTAYIYSNNSKLSSIADSSLKSMQTKNKEDVINVIRKNDKNIKVITLTSDEIDLETNLKPIFGSIIGLKDYKIKAQKQAKYENGKLIIEEKGK